MGDEGDAVSLLCCDGNVRKERHGTHRMLDDMIEQDVGNRVV